MSGIIGAIGVMLSCFLMFLSLWFESLENLMWLAFPLVTAFGFINSFTLLALIWHLEERQGVVSGFVNAAYQTSAVMIFVVIWLHSEGVTLPFAFLSLSGFAFVAALLAALVVPTQEEFFDQQQRVFGFRSKPPQFRPFHQIRDVFNVASSYKVENAVVVLVSMFVYLFVVGYISTVQTFIEINFDHPKAVQLSRLYTVVFTIAGAVSAPLSGLLFDAIGIVKFMFLLSLTTVAFILLTFIVQPWAVLTTFALATAYSGAWQTMLIKFCAIYGPPELLGSMYGIIFSFCGVFGIVVNLALPTIMSWLHVDNREPLFYYYQWCAFAIPATVGFLFLSIRMSCCAPPSTPPSCTSSHLPLCGSLDDDHDVDDETKPMLINDHDTEDEEDLVNMFYTK